jgi:phage gp46-like protein
MPTDLKMKWDAALMEGKLSFASNDVVTSASLLTAVIVSLFTDARAAADDILPDERNEERRGWWGDSTNTALVGDSVGSKLWLLEREKTVDAALKRVAEYAAEALQWMIDEGAAKSIGVETGTIKLISNTYVLGFSVSITKPDGVLESYKFEQEWRAT